MRERTYRQHNIKIATCLSFQVKVWFQNRRMKWRHQEMKERREQERHAVVTAVAATSSSSTSQLSTTTTTTMSMSNPPSASHAPASCPSLVSTTSPELLLREGLGAVNHAAPAEARSGLKRRRGDLDTDAEGDGGGGVCDVPLRLAKDPLRVIIPDSTMEGAATTTTAAVATDEIKVD